MTARLLFPDKWTTEWMEPRPQANLGAEAIQVRDAYTANVVNKSHGAFGALRVYSDFSNDTHQLDPDKRETLRQTVLLAAASMPFHDWWFRRQLRDEFGSFKIEPEALPMAALLMFVDSIQDDRRDLEGDAPAIQVLKVLKCHDGCLVTAEIDPRALTDLDLIEKIVEARDVCASMHQQAGHLQFKYPTWLVPGP